MQLDSGAGGREEEEIGGVKGCAYCGGLGHRISDCPKLETTRQKTTSATKADVEMYKRSKHSM